MRAFPSSVSCAVARKWDRLSSFTEIPFDPDDRELAATLGAGFIVAFGEPMLNMPKQIDLDWTDRIGVDVVGHDTKIVKTSYKKNCDELPAGLCLVCIALLFFYPLNHRAHETISREIKES